MQLTYRLVAAIQMLRQSKEVKIGSIIQNRGARGATDRTAQAAHQGVSPPTPGVSVTTGAAANG